MKHTQDTLTSISKRNIKFDYASSFAGSKQFKPTSSQIQLGSVKKSKMEGYDVIKPKENYSQTLKKHKNGTKSQVQLETTVSHENLNSNLAQSKSKRPTLDQNIEEQYIRGLQDEVKLLEYELKLLKDKELEEQTNFTSFFKYFNDGVPINDNIIAMKNVYSHTQRHLSDSVKDLELKLDDVEIKNQTVEEENAEYEEKCKELELLIAQKQEAFKKKQAELEKNEVKERFAHQDCEPEYKYLQDRTREYQIKIMKFNGEREKENLIAGRKEMLDQQALDKLKKQVLAVEEQFLEKKKDMEDKLNTDLFEHKTQFLEQQNEILKKQILGMKNDNSGVSIKIEEQKFILETQAKDRENDVSQRLTLLHKIFELKEQVEDQQKMTEGLVKQKVEELGREKVRKVEQEIDHILKRLDMVDRRNNNLEKENDEIIDDNQKLGLKFLELESQEEELKKQIKKIQEELHQIKVSFDIGTIKEEQVKEKIEPISQRQENLRKENALREKTIRVLKREIEKSEQQLDIISQFKNFNIEEARMAYQSNNQINKSIEKLLREYRKITFA